MPLHQCGWLKVTSKMVDRYFNNAILLCQRCTPTRKDTPHVGVDMLGAKRESNAKPLPCLEQARLTSTEL